MLESDDHTILEIDSDTGELLSSSVNDSVRTTKIEQSTVAVATTSSEKSRSPSDVAAECSGSDSDEHAGVFDYYPGPTTKTKTNDSFSNSDLNVANNRASAAAADSYKSDATRATNARCYAPSRDVSDWTRAREFGNASANNSTKDCDADDGIELKTVRPIYRTDDQSYKQYLSGLSRNNIDYVCTRTVDDDEEDEQPAVEDKNEETRGVRSEYQARRVSYGTIARQQSSYDEDDDKRRYGTGSSDTVGGMSSFPLSRSSEGLWSADADDRYGYGRSEVNSNAELLSYGGTGGGGGGGGGAYEGRMQGSERSLYMDRSSSRGELITHNSIINSAADCDQEERSHFLATHGRLSSSNSERNLESSRPILYFPDYQMFNNGTFLDGTGSSSALLAERAEVTRRMERKKLKKQIAEGKFKKSEDHPEYKGDMTVDEILEFINVGRINRRGLTTDDSSAHDVNDKTDKTSVKKNKKKVDSVQVDANGSDGEKVLRINVNECHPLGGAITETTAASAVEVLCPSSDDLTITKTSKFAREELFNLKPANDNNNQMRESAANQSSTSMSNGWTDDAIACDEDALDIVRRINIAGEKKIYPNKTVEYYDTNSETDSVVSSHQESSMSDAAVVTNVSEREVEFTTVRKKKKVKGAHEDNVRDFLRRSSDLAHGSVNSYGGYSKKPTKTRYVTGGSGGGGGIHAPQGAGGGGSRSQFESVRQSADSVNFNGSGHRATQFSDRQRPMKTTKIIKAQAPLESSPSIPCHGVKTSPNSVELNETSLNVASAVDTLTSSRATTTEEVPTISKLNNVPSYAKMVGDATRDISVSSFAPANFPNLPPSSSSSSSSSFARRNSTGNVEPEAANEPLVCAAKTSVAPSLPPPTTAVKVIPCAISYASIAKGGGGGGIPKSGEVSSAVKTEKEQRRRSLESVEIDAMPIIANQLNFPPIVGSRESDERRTVSAEKPEPRHAEDDVIVTTETNEMSLNCETIGRSDHCGATQCAHRSAKQSYAQCSSAASTENKTCVCKQFVENSSNDVLNGAETSELVDANIVDNKPCDTVPACDEHSTVVLDTSPSERSRLGDNQLPAASFVIATPLITTPLIATPVIATPLISSSVRSTTTLLVSKITNQDSTVTASYPSSSLNKSKPNASGPPMLSGKTTVGSCSRMQAEPVVFLDVRNYRHEQITSKEIGISFGFDASESVDSGLGDICSGGDTGGCSDVGVVSSSEEMFGCDEVCSTAAARENTHHVPCAVAVNAVSAFCGNNASDAAMSFMIPTATVSCHNVVVPTSLSCTVAGAATSGATDASAIVSANNAIHAVSSNAQPPHAGAIISHLKCSKCQQESDGGSNNNNSAVVTTTTTTTRCNNKDTATSPILAGEYEAAAAAINSSSADGYGLIPHSVTSEDFSITNSSRSIGGASVPVVYVVSQASHSRPIALMSGTSSAQGPPRAPVGVVPPLHFDRSKPVVDATTSNLKDASSGYISVNSSSLQGIDSSYAGGKSILSEEELRNEPRRKTAQNSSCRKVSGKCSDVGGAENKTTGCFDLSGAQLFVFKGYEETIASKKKYPTETMSYCPDA